MYTSGTAYRCDFGFVRGELSSAVGERAASFDFELFGRRTALHRCVGVVARCRRHALESTSRYNQQQRRSMTSHTSHNKSHQRRHAHRLAPLHVPVLLRAHTHTNTVVSVVCVCLSLVGQHLDIIHLVHDQRRLSDSVD